MYDVIVIGGGVVGSLILKELSTYRLKCLLLEASDDLSYGASRANSGIVHAGYDAVPGTLKAKFNVLGNAMFDDLTEELGVPFKRNGSLVAALENEKDKLNELLDRANKNGVPASIISRDEILKLEPEIADGVQYALYAPTAGIVSPYKLTIKAGDYAVINGAEVLLEQKVIGLKRNDDHYIVTTEKGCFESKTVVNAAGAGAVTVNGYLNEITPEAVFKRGEYYILDKTESERVNTVIFPLPDENGKGILVSPTADGNVIYGPTSVSSEPNDTSVQLDGLDKIRKGVTKTFKPNFRKAIRLYAGVRVSVGDDFIIQEGKNSGYIMLLGICSPGLTASPAIAKYVVEELLSKRIPLEKKEHLKSLPKHKAIAKLSPEEINELVKQDERWGRVICRCETVSEKEIVDAIHSPIPATTVDAVKRRVRAGMGRCQGGFCMPKVIEILSRELNIPLTEVKKGGQGSEIAIGRVEEVVYEN